MKSSESTPKHWLILSYCSNIAGSACAQHIDDRIPYFKKNGIEPIMLTGFLGEKTPGIVHSRTPSLAPSGIRCELRHLLSRKLGTGLLLRLIKAIITLILLPFYLLEKILLNIEEGWSWFPIATIMGLHLTSRFKPEVIYSTGGTPSAHLASLMISKISKVPWIAEFQDPLVFKDWEKSKREYIYYLWLEKLICKHASAVIFLTQEAKNSAQKRTSLADKGHTVYPGSNKEIFPINNYTKKATCHFVHLGSLDGSRNLITFLKAIEKVFKSNSALINVIKLDLYGSIDKKTSKHIKQFPFRNTIKYHGKLSRAKSLAKMKEADCLLLIQNTKTFSFETIPSKVYEYFFSGRPILGLIYRNQELKIMLEKENHFVAQADNVEEIYDLIKKIVNLFMTNQLTAVKNHSNWLVGNAVKSIIDLKKNFRNSKISSLDSIKHG